MKQPGFFDVKERLARVEWAWRSVGGFEKPLGFEVCSVIPFFRFLLEEWRHETARFL